MSNLGVLRVTTPVYKDILSNIGNGNKIAAIKVLRHATNVGLKDAKWAVERLAYEKYGGKRKPSKSALKVISGPIVIKVVLDYGDGPIELDVEGMQLKALTDLQCVGLGECAHMLGLVDVFEAISAGKKVYIAEGENEE